MTGFRLTVGVLPTHAHLTFLPLVVSSYRESWQTEHRPLPWPLGSGPHPSLLLQTGGHGKSSFPPGLCFLICTMETALASATQSCCANYRTLSFELMIRFIKGLAQRLFITVIPKPVNELEGISCFHCCYRCPHYKSLHCLGLWMCSTAGWTVALNPPTLMIH